MVPDKQKGEWKELIIGKYRPEISSFSLQMKINTLLTAYQKGEIELDLAVTDLHSLCVKYEKIYYNDLKMIFPDLEN